MPLLTTDRIGDSTKGQQHHPRCQTKPNVFSCALLKIAKICKTVIYCAEMPTTCVHMCSIVLTETPEHLGNKTKRNMKNKTNDDNTSLGSRCSHHYLCKGTQVAKRAWARSPGGGARGAIARGRVWGVGGAGPECCCEYVPQTLKV